MTTQDNAAVTLYEQKKNDRWRLAQALAVSDLCPKQFKNKPADVAIVLHQAETLGCDPQSALQNIFVVKGTPGYSSKFMIALANRSGVFSGPIRFRYEGEGKTLTVIAWAKLSDDGEVVESIPVGMKMAVQAGWTSNAIYQKTPALILSYRAAAFLIRLYCPEVTMGMLSVEELRDMGHSGSGNEQTNAPDTITALNELLTTAVEPEVAPEQADAEDADFTPLDDDGEPNEFIGHTEMFPDSAVKAEDPA